MDIPLDDYLFENFTAKSKEKDEEYIPISEQPLVGFHASISNDLKGFFEIIRPEQRN